MEVRGTYRFEAPAGGVWTLLMDSATVAECLPGCEHLGPLGEDRYRATLRVGLAAIVGTYEGLVTITDKQPPHAYRLLFEGSGQAGFVKGEAAVRLREEGAHTIVEVNGTAQLGGTVARVGQRLLGSVAKMLMDRFFGCLQRKAQEPGA